MSEYKLPQSRSYVKRELISIFTSWVDNRFGENDLDSCWFNQMSSDLVTLHKDLIEKSGLRELAAIKAVDEEFFGILREMIESDLIRQFEDIGDISPKVDIVTEQDRLDYLQSLITDASSASSARLVF